MQPSVSNRGELRDAILPPPIRSLNFIDIWAEAASSEWEWPALEMAPSSA